MFHLIRPFIIALLFTSFPGQLYAKGCLQIASIAQAFGFSKFYMLQDVKKTFTRAGECADIVEMPSKRITRDFIKGRIDGELFRNKIYAQKLNGKAVYPQTPLISIPQYIITLKGSGFRPSSLADIGDKQIGYISEVEFHQRLIPKIKNVKSSRDYVNLAQQLKAGRIDGFISNALVNSLLIKRKHLKADEIYQSYPVFHASVYLLLHKKHAHLLKRLDEAIREVKAEGGFQLPEPD